jgi:predicted transcriptional regulator
MPSKTISVRLTSETLTKLDTLAEALQRPRAWLIAHAIERYVDTEAWQVAAIQQAAQELAQGEADLIGHDEIAAWLSSWGTAQETAPPPCA